VSGTFFLSGTMRQGTLEKVPDTSPPPTKVILGTRTITQWRSSCGKIALIERHGRQGRSSTRYARAQATGGARGPYTGSRIGRPQGRKSTLRHVHLSYPWLAVVLVMAQIPKPACGAQRNLSGGDVLGPLTIPAYESESTHKTHAELRSFLWNHWREHRRGYAVVTEHSVEEHSESCTTTYWVQPGRQGNWQISAKWNCTTHPKTGSFAFVSVKRFARDPNGRVTDALLQETADLPAAAYGLVLQNKSGRIRWEL
jgi:hypothetical protein